MGLVNNFDRSIVLNEKERFNLIFNLFSFTNWAFSGLKKA
jgi:hypothetical protein